jgi:hypothetical protein
MASLNSLLAKANIPSASSVAGGVKSQIKTSIQATSNEIRNIPGNIVKSGVAQAQGAVSAGLNAGVTAVRSAAMQAITGDFSGALTTLASGPQNVLGAFGSTFGLSSAGGTLGQNGGVTNTLQGALSRADPMISFQWYCELPTITPVGGTPKNLAWNYVEEATPAFRTYDVRQVYAQGRQHKFASTYSVDNLRLNFYADIANQSLSYLLAWDGAILAPFGSVDATKGGGFGRPSDYQKPIRIYCVDSARALVMMFEFTECWPNLEGLHLDSGSSTRLTYNVNFNVGDVFVTLFGVNNNMSGSSLLTTLASSAANSALGSAFKSLTSFA